MIASKILAIVTLALSVSAAPTAGGSFKLGVTIPSGKTVYLTDSERFTSDKSKALDCSLEGTKIFCGPEKKGLTYGTALSGGHTSSPLRPEVGARRNGPFTISNDGTISWKTSDGVVNFSTKTRSDTETIYAEVCHSSGHPDKIAFYPGTAKAYYNK